MSYRNVKFPSFLFMNVATQNGGKMVMTTGGLFYLTVTPTGGVVVESSNSTSEDNI